MPFLCDIYCFPSVQEKKLSYSHIVLGLTLTLEKELERETFSFCKFFCSFCNTTWWCVYFYSTECCWYPSFGFFLRNAALTWLGDFFMIECSSLTSYIDVLWLNRNLPEVRSAHEILGIPSVSARFGTAPFFWNWGMSAMTNLLPRVSIQTEICYFILFNNFLSLPLTGNFSRKFVEIIVATIISYPSTGIFKRQKQSAATGAAIWSCCSSNRWNCRGACIHKGEVRCELVHW